MNQIDRDHPVEEGTTKHSDRIWQDIKSICVKTLFSGIHAIDHIFRTSKSQDVENSLCFQIFGFDVLIDRDLKSWLLEVNHSPSFLAESPLDYKVKKNLLRDTLHMIGLNQKRKNKYLNTARNEKERRMIELGKKNHKDKMEERQAQREKKLRQKDQYENNNMGDF